MAETRTHTIPLRRKVTKAPRYKRAKKAVSVIKDYMERHMKSEDVKLSPALNEHIWKNGIKNPPGKVRVVGYKEDGSVNVLLEDEHIERQRIIQEVEKAQAEKEKADDSEEEPEQEVAEEDKDSEKEE